MSKCCSNVEIWKECVRVDLCSHGQNSGGSPEGCSVYVVHLVVWESDNSKHMLGFSMTLGTWNDLLLTFVYIWVGSSQL